MARVVVMFAVVMLTACAKRAEPPASKRAPVPAAPEAKPALREDPVLAAQATKQWREHMQKEEDERQLGFDRRALKQHRVVVGLITASRARYDRAQTVGAVTQARVDARQKVAEIRKRVHEIDHWGVNSRLLPDYAALCSSLEDAYPAVKLAAISGNEQPIAEVRADFERRMEKIAAWLKEAEESDEEE